MRIKVWVLSFLAAAAQLIEAVFIHIPAQLSAVFDEPVKRFRFKGVYDSKSHYTDAEIEFVVANDVGQLG